ncbi:MAG: citrate/2-methylcitrate synthase [Candidatus Helarchaeota archaeon]
MTDVQKGLEKVIALETKISYIDGERGLLEYRGININELVKLTFLEVSHLLIFGHLPNNDELEDFFNQMHDNRDIDDEVLNLLKICNFNIEGMDALRTIISYLSHCDQDLNDNSMTANIRKATKLIAKFPTIVAAFHRISELEDVIHPDPSLSHGANFLYMLKGFRPKDIEARIMETDFIISAEHELNASTFSARVTASTTSDIYSAIISGLGTLKGRLHGGARLAVMEMLDEIPSPDEAEKYTLDLISKKQRIMGFGHRVYKTHDPRGLIFKKLAIQIAKENKDMTWYDTAQKIENTVFQEIVEKKNKPIYPNVDFYAGVVYKYLEIPPLLATSVFAIGRIAGWLAHCIEQYGDNRLIRPRARYIGEHEIHLRK